MGQRTSRLIALSEVENACKVQGRCYAGIRNVAIGLIRGSEGRCKDFDGDFNPIQDHCTSRWLRVAAARDQGKALPPVELIQVGDLYFVRDGHHRISVARALGQLDIEAEVTVWEVAGQLPWDEPVGPSRPGLMDRILHTGLGSKLHVLGARREAARAPAGP